MKRIIMRMFAMLLMAMATITNANAQDIYDLQGKNEKVDIEKKISKAERKALTMRKSTFCPTSTHTASRSQAE